MALKLTLAPDQAGYATYDGPGVLSTQLDGGAARYRSDVLNAYSTVSVQWRINPLEWRYLRSFYNLLAGKGAKTFLLDLYLDQEVLTEHRCHFVPGTFALVGQQGKQFTITAQIEAKPTILSDDEEEAERVWATLYGIFGDDYETLFPPIESDFDDTVTFDLPAIRPTGPALPGEIQQQLTGYVDGGWVDSIGELTIPVAVGVPCMAYNGLQSTELSDIIIGVETVEFWAYPDAATEQRVVQGAADFFGIHGTGYWTARIDAVWALTTATVLVGEWQHVKYVANGSAYELYLNGSLEGTIPYTTLLTADRIGNMEFRGFDGKLALVKINGHNYTLSESSGLPLDSSGLGNDALSNTGTWTDSGVDSLPSYLMEFGFTPNAYSGDIPQAPFFPALTNKTKSVFTTDGVGDATNSTSPVPISTWSTFYGCVVMLIRAGDNPVTTSRVLSVQHTGVDDIRLWVFDDTGGMRVTMDDGDDSNSVSFQAPLDTFFSVAITHDGSTLRVSVDTFNVGDAMRAFDYAGATGVTSVAKSANGGSYSAITVKSVQIGSSPTTLSIDYDYTEYLGKSTDSIVNHADATNPGIVESGAGGLEAIWAVRPADPAGIIVDSAGYDLTTHHGGYVHNGAPEGLLQTDPDTNAFGGVTIWGDGVSWSPVGYADLRMRDQGALNLWLTCVDIGGVPHYQQVDQYPATLYINPVEHAQNLREFGDNCGAGIE